MVCAFFGGVSNDCFVRLFSVVECGLDDYARLLCADARKNDCSNDVLYVGGRRRCSGLPSHVEAGIVDCAPLKHNM